ncbi:Dabb family protein [Yoonia litorea]|uniref:Stress responsive A/B Barrel Domain n=1 Tax=Yoonia litorea TaxID=1123755 RepID=A0A1I6MXI8_9RHOB|nr:Dabb family protein [Yoonia litorea]SFS20425.1 Stress responsive A/B Barrel Domain [Yoonia litorea]
MIQHIVMLDLPADHDSAELANVMAGLGALMHEIDGFLAFAHGPNRDFEGKSPDCAYAFVCTFADAAAVSAYHRDPTHQALGARLVALCQGGADGITVVDMEAEG